MTAEVELDVIIEALEMADDSISSYLDVETGEVHSITEEESRNRGASDTWLYLTSLMFTSGP
jgi:hypothetical protein